MATLLPVHQTISDSSQEKGFQAFFRKLPEKPSTTIRIFDRNDFYTVHGDDAHLAARQVFKTSSVVRQFKEGEYTLEYVTLSKLNFESFVKELLLVLKYRVEVYRCYGNVKTSTDWRLELQGSPGNLTQFEELLFGSSGMQEGNGVLAVKVAQTPTSLTVGAAMGDASLQQFVVSEFADGECLSNLEALAVQLGPKECLVLAGDPLVEIVKQIMERNSVLVTELKRADFASHDVIADLNKLLKFKRGTHADASVLPETSSQLAMTSLSAVIKYLQLLSSEESFGQYSLESFDLTQYMRLDSAAVRALNLLPTPQDTSPSHSLLGLLNQCRTAQGSRLLAQWVKQPLVDPNKIDERLDLVEALTEDTELRQSLLEDHLRKMPDFHRLAKRLKRRRAGLQECYRIYQAIRCIPALVARLEAIGGRHQAVISATLVQPLKLSIAEFEKFLQMVETTMDLERVDKGEFVVKAEFDEDLEELRGKLTQLESELEKQVRRAAADLSLEPNKTLKLESTAQTGFFFRVTKKEEKALRNNRLYTIFEANKSGVKFRSGELARLNDEHQLTREAYTEQQKAVVSEIVAIAAGYMEPMLGLNATTARLDALVSLAAAGVSAPQPYTRPRLLRPGQPGPTQLTQLRHPCLERLDGLAYIPNDVHFEHGKSTFKVITGPNMGGKSTYIRSAAVAVVMAQIGCFVPCESAVLRPVDAVMARVGAGDCQMKGVSTFMAEMLETAAILRSATKNSLIVIDELGRGTSTYDGFGLAWAISEHIVRDIGAFTLFATHFHELTGLAEQLPTVQNLYVTALTSGQGLTFLYKVQPGICDQSFGIHVAEMVKFPPQVIEDARKRAGELEDFYGSPDDPPMSAAAESDPDRPAGKCAKLDTQEGSQAVDTFLNEYDNLVGRLSGQELQAAVQKLMQDVRDQGDPYVTHLLTRLGLH